MGKQLTELEEKKKDETSKISENSTSGEADSGLKKIKPVPSLSLRLNSGTSFMEETQDVLNKVKSEYKTDMKTRRVENFNGEILDKELLYDDVVMKSIEILEKLNSNDDNVLEVSRENIIGTGGEYGDIFSRLDGGNEEPIGLAKVNEERYAANVKAEHFEFLKKEGDKLADGFGAVERRIDREKAKSRGRVEEIVYTSKKAMRKESKKYETSFGLIQKKLDELVQIT
ncbi:hypothetical protein BB559_002223 [Furculomyces boomerangus]|uniref:Uncharacterized protein n=2 Tax=Harpellales TaxID=61421 RepID=A0A2T9YX15_9FUNG|nr:hypothetical protein BB559_002223 [Furculomyces boomerangus]